MTHQDLLNKIHYALQMDCDTRVHYTQKVYRLPIVGRFVKLEDHEELLKKRMIRYVTKGKMESYLLSKDLVGNGRYCTRIINLEEIADIKTFV